MLAAETANTTAKPSMIFERNRRVGSLSDRGQIRFDIATLNPRLLSESQSNREYGLRHLVPRTRAEWIKGRKYAPNPRPDVPGRRLCGASLWGLGRRQWLPIGGQLQLRFSQRLQLLQRHAWNHLDHHQSLWRHVDHREVGVDALDATGRGQRIGASLEDARLTLLAGVVHDDADLPGADRQIHGAADAGRECRVFGGP